MTVVLPILLGIGVFAYIFRQPLQRVARYLKAWQEADEVDDACHSAAVREVSGEDEDPGAAGTLHEKT